MRRVIAQFVGYDDAGSYGNRTGAQRVDRPGRHGVRAFSSSDDRNRGRQVADR
jgi:hypothetical protein